MKDDGPFVLPLMRVDCQLTAGDQIFRLHMDVQGGRKRASSSQPSPIDGSIKQRLAAGHHEGSTGTGASGRFRSTRTACTPFKITTATGKEKNQTQPLLRTGLVQRCTFPSGCREIIAEIYPQIHWERRGDRKEKPSLAVLPPFPFFRWCGHGRL